MLLWRAYPAVVYFLWGQFYISKFTVADSKGKEIDQCTLLKYLAETMWFSTAALNGYLTWEEMEQYNTNVTIIKFAFRKRQPSWV